MTINVAKIRKYNVIGVRGLTDDEEYKIGDTCRNSFDWDYENDISSYDTESPVELNGTCAVDTMIDTNFDDDDEIVEKIEAIVNNFHYLGEVVVIAGNSFDYGADENEIIIEDAVVIAK